MVTSILTNIAFNIFIALLYIIGFVCIRKFCSKTDQRKARLIQNRRNTSFIEQNEKNQEKMIINDIILNEGETERI
jgi:hypothetical protein